MSQAGTSGGGGGGTVLSVSGGLNINITGAAATPIVNLNDTVDLPNTNMAGTEGVYLFNSVKFMHNRGTLNTFLGADAGTLILTTASAVENTGIGAGALSGLTTGADNTCVGLLAGYLITTGSNNCIFGSGSGASMGATSSSNILINHPGAAESNTIRIGYQGSGAAQQDKTYIAGIYNTNIGATYEPVFADSDHKLGTNGIVDVPHGGTGNATATNHGVILGQGTSPYVATAVGTNNQVLLGNTGADPSWGQASLTASVTGVLPIANGGTNASSMATTNGVTYFDGTRLVVTAAGTTGQVLTGNTGSAPTWGTASGGGLTWNEVTGTSQSAAINNGYICNNAGLVTVTLPSTAALGSVVRIAGKGAGGWKVAQNSGQTIYFGTSTTTTGTGGSLASSATRDAVELVCVTANNDWDVISSIGNITVV